MKANNLAWLTAATLFSGAALADVNYKIDLTQSPEHHLANVEVVFPKADSDSLTVNLPIWRTGKYTVLPISDGIRKFTAKDSKGNELPWQRTETGEWQVKLSKPTQVSVSYQLYANELGSRTRHISATHAYLDASAVFMYSPTFRNDDVNVELEVPNGWRSFSGMDYGSNKHSFTAPNYDVLVDSPIETGINKHREFTADGRSYELVVWGEGNYDVDQIVTDLKKISSQADRLWDGYPFKRYVYMVHATSGARGATEHLNSTIIQLPRFMFRERKDYLRFISTASHEFIHTWNVKAYRPEQIATYNYQKEVVTPLLWLAEGSTSYFQNQLLLSGGVMKPKEFFADLSKRIQGNENKPGKETQSAASTSLGTWASTGGDYAHNFSVNIYSEGYMVSMALDHKIMEQTDLAKSYRDVQRELYRNHKVPKGYTSEDVKGIAEQLTGKSYDTWWTKHIDSPVSLDFDALLKHAGLKLDRGAKTEVYTGIKLGRGDNGLALSRVQKDSPAWKAGIGAGDQLVAINGLKVTGKGFQKRLDDFKAGDVVSVTLFQDDQLNTVKLKLAEKAKGKYSIKSVEKPTKHQKAFLKMWLGIEWPFDENGKFIK
ncbi:M61 family metallopeptidase [Shewanella sp. 202IG2-18]|uniref:M61 family metallopeptidase n=1 Tax=Parashewanella hymeniacidonis TaxID=2807618 RepID=UPI00195F3F79|nr:M61 family metallopeptidase [Parashewanella hymeniacidonis]